MDYNQLHAHERDSQIHFNADDHIYTHNGQTLESVTTIVEACFEQFDAEYWAARKATEEKPAEVLIAEWAENGRQARDLGTLMHDRIEHYYLGYGLDEESSSDETFRLFLDFTKSFELKPYRTEWRIFYEEYGIAGTLDFLNYDGNEFVIYDWKRSTKLVDTATQTIIAESRFRKTAFPPLQELPDTTYYHYALQVSIYRYILEQKYGINVSRSKLGVFHPENGRYYVIDLPYLREQVVKLLDSRIK